MDKTEELINKLIEDEKEGRLSRGATEAVQMYRDGKKGFRTCSNRRFTAYELKTFLWDKEVKDFVKTIMSIGITRFVYTNTSTAVMDNLHLLEQEGCCIRGLAVMEKVEKGFFDEDKKGIEIEVSEW
jgi:hypothetical protein